METFLLTFVVLAVLILAMSVGVLMGRKPIKGSCGGVGAALGETEYICPVCGDDPNLCEKEMEQAAQQKSQTDADLAYELKSPKKD